MTYIGIRNHQSVAILKQNLINLGMTFDFGKTLKHSLVIEIETFSFFSKRPILIYLLREGI